MIKSKMQELYALEQLSGGSTAIHRLHPAVKLLTTMVFLITVLSFDRYAPGRLIPYIFYPTLLMAVSETPYAMLIKRFMIALPFGLLAGISNVIFDRAAAFSFYGIPISYGFLSLCMILFRTYLCVMAILLLVSVTPFTDITDAMRRFRIPSVFIIIFEMTYRYIGVLFGEASSMHTAYSLRNPGGKGIRMKDMGSYAGQLLIRSFDRADRIYHAMKCRGYMLYTLPRQSRQLRPGDWIFFLAVCLFCILFRIVP